jgi:hypothetical protein
MPASTEYQITRAIVTERNGRTQVNYTIGGCAGYGILRDGKIFQAGYGIVSREPMNQQQADAILAYATR